MHPMIDSTCAVNGLLMLAAVLPATLTCTAATVTEPNDTTGAGQC